MKSRVVSLFPQRLFEQAGVSLPVELDFRFVDARSEEEIISACHDADFLFVPAAYPAVTPRILQSIPTVRLIQSSGTGFDMVDVETAARLHIPVANAPGHNAVTVAEFTLSILVVLQRHILLSDREIKKGNYAALREQFFRSGLKELSDARLGLVGLGNIGRKVAQLTFLLGAKTDYFDIRRVPEKVEKELGVCYKSLDELLAGCDVISLHLPLNQQTRGLIGSRELLLMPRGSLLINTSRGEVVDQKALAEALESGHLAGAAIDTVSPEPPPADHPLLNLSPAARDRLLITPHIAGITKGALHRMLEEGLANLVRVAAGDPPLHVVNAVPHARERERP
jgi:phosphoglycerate dehydrogenase-like enzyme